MTKSAKRGAATSKINAATIVLKPAKTKRRKSKGMQKGNYTSNAMSEGNRAPRTQSDKSGTIVTHSETYGINVTGTSSFSVFSNWAIQPGISVYSNGSPLGSWLPQIGNNFDNYEIKHLKFVYRASCSTLEPGLVAFAYEPNPVGSVPGTLQELRNMKSVMGTVHNDLSFDVSNVSRKPLLTRKGAVVGYPNYDAGKVFFATNGCTDAAKLGFVEVHYTVRFFNPQSSLSTTTPTITYDPVAPVQRWTYTPPSTLGADNVASACITPFSAALGGALIDQGAPLFRRVTGTTPALASTFSGYQFNQSSATHTTLQCLYPGRYRLKAQLNGNFQDLRLFALCPFKKTTIGLSYELATTLVSDSVLGNTTAEIGVIPVSGRGFTGVVTLDPDPATDLSMFGEWDVVLDVDDRLALALGVRTYNNISTTTAQFNYALGCGISYVEVQYLGPTT